MSVRLCRPLAVVLSSLFTLTVAFSCTRVLDLEGHQDAVAALCEQYNRCFQASYPGCADLSASRLSGADAALRTSWLQGFAVGGCLDTCQATRDCMDHAPVCGDPSDACEILEGCCGFTDGTSLCTNGQCCLADGIACEDASACCTGSCIDGTCGGKQCAFAGDDCISDAGCCGSLVCSADRTCFDCHPPGTECGADGDCCVGACDDGVCRTTCDSAGTPCISDGQCCSNLCVSSGDASPVCADANCSPDGASCTDPTPCCSNLCDNDVCGGASCRAVGDLCDDDGGCCSTKCLITASTPAVCCALPSDGLCAHDPCAEGPALDPACDVPGDLACIAATCDEQPYCCCQDWDRACVKTYARVCGVACPAPTM